VVVADDQNRCGWASVARAALEDFHFREKIFHFDHERIPSGWCTPAGNGAHGFFENYGSLAEVTSADLSSGWGADPGVRAVLDRGGQQGLRRSCPGRARLRGSSLYTKQGNWDLVGNNIPVFFIQDAIKFPDVIHAAKQEPDRGFPAGADGAR